MAEPALKHLNLSGLKPSALPAASATAADLTPLITTLLDEALPLLDSITSPTAPTLWKSKGTKTFPESTAPVAVTERTIASEFWACRRSVHADTATQGSASWAEFGRCLRDAHAATEDAFTPTVLAHREARAWDAAAAAAAGEVAGWSGFKLMLVEMKHRVPAPLKPRVFTVVQLVAQRPGRDEFVVVSVPVDGFAEEGGELAVLSREKGVVVGAYAAVERVRRLEGGEIEWVMATVSDARGVLPMWVQTKAVPGQVAKDVALFLGWIESERKGKGEYGDSGNGAAANETNEGVAAARE